MRAVRTGRHMGANGRPILPPMPWPNVAQLSDADIKAMFALLKMQAAAAAAHGNNAVFWAHLDDRDLGALTRRIVVSIPPARLLHWQQQVLMPAWSAPEIAAAAARQPSPI